VNISNELGAAVSLIVPHRYSSVRHSHITEDIKKTISANQEEVKGAIATTDKQLIVLENKLEELNLSSDDEDTDEPVEGKAEALRQYEEERKAIIISRKLLDELLAKAQEEAVAKAAAQNRVNSTTVGNVTFGNQNSGQQAGVINGGVHGAVFGGR
jgi:flavin-dependent dehydrogenase